MIQYKKIRKAGGKMLKEQIQKLQEMIDDSKRIVFFGGAGVSTESNIPDFRSADGIYHQSYKYSPEEVVSHSFFVRNTEAFYDFYKDIKTMKIKKKKKELIYSFLQKYYFLVFNLLC